MLLNGLHRSHTRVFSFFFMIALLGMKWMLAVDLEGGSVVLDHWCDGQVAQSQACGFSTAFYFYGSPSEYLVRHSQLLIFILWQPSSFQKTTLTTHRHFCVGDSNKKRSREWPSKHSKIFRHEVFESHCRDDHDNSAAAGQNLTQSASRA
jgi:hypothetical protein